MTSLNDNGLEISGQDLSTVSPSSDDDDRLFNHDGSSQIQLVDGSTTSEKGFYLWDNTAGAWRAQRAQVASVSGNRLYAQSTEPTASSGDIWIDTS